MPDGIRDQYKKIGVEEYYSQHGSDYSNPHFLQIEQLLSQNKSRIDYSKVLDFCCGSGEVSAILKELGYAHTVASDPFTQEAYKQRISKDCYHWSFEEVVKGTMKGSYSAIICSFAMHLCPDEWLFGLTYELFQHTDLLVIITPHKRPELDKIEGVEMAFEDFALTPKGKKVKLKAYRSIFTRH